MGKWSLWDSIPAIKITWLLKNNKTKRVLFKSKTVKAMAHTNLKYLGGFTCTANCRILFK